MKKKFSLSFSIQQTAEIKTPPSNTGIMCVIYWTSVALTSPSVHPLQDAVDAVGYFQLALAAALEDQANPQALYVVYMKLAEIHGSHIPDAGLCQVYRDRAQSLKRVLAGEDAAEDVERFECTESSLTPVPDAMKSQAASLPATRAAPLGDSDAFGGDADEKDEALKPRRAPATSASRSHSDSTFTESFDTAREHISDSSSSTDTLQTDRRPAQEEGGDSHADSVLAHSSVSGAGMGDSRIQASTKL